MPLHLGLSSNNSSQQQEAAREARRVLQQKVKNTWDYPSAPHPNTHTPASVDARTAVAEAVIDEEAPTPGLLDFEPTSWREREYSDIETLSDVEAASDRAGRSGVKDAPTEKEIRIRKRKRAEKLEEEMSWNVGLAHFSAQRNAWTSARVASPRPSSSDSTSFTTSTTSFSSDMEAEPSNSHNHGQLAVTQDANVALPICPKLLPDHPVRSKISNNTYTEIYSKIILQGRTPTVPINLQDVTNALIHGWKEEGNWPPKTAEPEPSIASNRGAAAGAVKHMRLTKGVKAVTKVFQGLTGGPADTASGKGALG